MRLLSRNQDGLKISANTAPDKPYAILSHTWLQDNDEELTFIDITNPEPRWRKLATRLHGYEKVDFCLRQAARDGLQDVWIDTCCIDKRDANELDDAIANMYTYYAEAAVCYVLLTDVHSSSWREEFGKSRWFRRGWTLQELVAPDKVRFYTKEEEFIGTKEELRDMILDAGRVDCQHRLTTSSIPAAAIPERFAWCLSRETTKPADRWYCMLGLLGVYVSYAAGKKADDVQRELVTAIKDKYGYEAASNVDRVYHAWQDSNRPRVALPLIIRQADSMTPTSGSPMNLSQDSTPSSAKIHTQRKPANNSFDAHHHVLRVNKRGEHSHHSRSTSSHSTVPATASRRRRASSTASSGLRPPRPVVQSVSDPTAAASHRSNKIDSNNSHDNASTLREAVLANDLDRVCELLDSGVGVDARIRMAPTVLYDAMSEQVDKRIFEELLSRGANVNIEARAVMTPVHWLCIRRPRTEHDFWYLNKLYDHGAHFDAGEDGWRPFHSLCLKGDAHDERKQILVRTFLNCTSRHSGFNLQRDVELFHLTASGQRSQDELAQVLAVLLHHTASLHCRELSTGRMPIHYASDHNRSTDCLQVLLKAGSSVNVKDHRGLTPLHLAAEYGSVESVQLLLDHGANTQERDPNRRLPVDIAHDAHTYASDVYKRCRSRPWPNRSSTVAHLRTPSSAQEEQTFKARLAETRAIHDLLKRWKLQPQKVVLHDTT